MHIREVGGKLQNSFFFCYQKVEAFVFNPPESVLIRATFCWINCYKSLGHVSSNITCLNSIFTHPVLNIFQIASSNSDKGPFLFLRTLCLVDGFIDDPWNKFPPCFAVR